MIRRLELQPLLDELQVEFGDGLLGVVLYGSHARGTAKPESDIDLLLVSRALPKSRAERAKKFIQVQLRAGYPSLRASILGKTADEFETQFPSLFLDIGLDGVILFDRAGYSTRKLARIREVIKEAGLSRQPLKGEFTWQFSQPVPPARWIVDWDGYRER